MPEDDECVSSSAASPFYTSHKGRLILPGELLDDAGIDPSALTSTWSGRQPSGQVVPGWLGHAGIDPSSALTSTLSGRQPFGQVVPWRLGHARTNPSASLSPKRRGHTPLIARPGLHHQRSWTPHLLHTQHVANASDRVPNPFLSRSLGSDGSNGESLAFQPSFYLLASRPCHLLPRLPLGARPRPGLDGRGQNRAAPTKEILSKSSSILPWQGWWLVPRQTTSPHDVIRSPKACAFFIRLVGTRR